MKPRLACCILLAFAANAWGAVQEKTAQPNEIYEIIVDQPSAVLIQEPLGLKYKSYWLAEEKQAIVFSTGNHPRIVLSVFSNGDPIPNVEQFVIRMDPGPGPGPKPPPEPDNPDNPKLPPLAKWIRDNGRKHGIKRTVAEAIANNYETVSSKISAVSMTARQARDELVQLQEQTAKTHKLPRAAQHIEAKISEVLNKSGEDVQAIQETFDILALGWKAI